MKNYRSPFQVCKFKLKNFACGAYNLSFYMCIAFKSLVFMNNFKFIIKIYCKFHVAFVNKNNFEVTTFLPAAQTLVTLR